MEANVYEQFAQLEENHFWFQGRRRIFFDLLDRELAGRNDLEILEIGCGAGGMLGPLSRYGKVTGIDVAHDYMRYCRQRGYTRVVAGSGYELPFPDRSFDLVALFDVIEHIPDDRRVLREAHRVLRPGGRVFVSVPAYQFLFSQNDRVAHHLRRYTSRSLRAALEAAGLQIRKLSYFNTFLFPLIVPAVLVLKAKERLFGLPEGQTNLSHQFAPPVNAAFGAIMTSERLLLRHIGFPFGHSLLALAG
jgi:SAM-dependent methyltransferase